MNIVDLLQSGYGSGLARLARASLKMDEGDVEASAAVRVALEQLFKRDTPHGRKALAVGAAALSALPKKRRDVGAEMLMDLLHAACLSRIHQGDAALVIVEGWREMLRPLLVSHWEDAQRLECTGELEDRARAALLREEAYELEASFDVIAADVLPLDREPAESRPPEPARPPSRPQLGLVLLVDDDDDVRESLGIFLEGNGFEVVGAENGARAIAILEQGVRPNVILLDLMMPVMSGWDFHKWQQRQPTAAPPTIVFTATGLKQGSLGALRILSKTAHSDVLLSELRAAVAPVAA